jgi:FtsH-binding integral membrane protein
MPEDARSRARILAFVGGALAVIGMIWGSVIGYYEDQRWMVWGLVVAGLVLMVLSQKMRARIESSEDKQRFQEPEKTGH